MGDLKHVVSPALLKFTRNFVGPLAITLFENNLHSKILDNTNSYEVVIQSILLTLLFTSVYVISLHRVLFVRLVVALVLKSEGL